MDCSQSKSQIKQKIPLWLAGELNTAEREVISVHVQSCKSCQAEVKFWQAVNHTLHEDLTNLKAPPGFSSAVISRINQQDRIAKINNANKKPYWAAKLPHYLKRHLAAAAAFILLATGSIGIYSQLGGNEQGQLAINPTEPNISVQPLTNEQDMDKSTDNTETLPDINPSTDVSKQNEQDLPPPKDQATAPNTTSDRDTQINQDVIDRSSANQSELPENNVPSVNVPTSESEVSETIQAPLTEADLPYALLSTEKNRVTNRMLLQIKVNDLGTSHNLALQYINNSIAEYEILGTENTIAGSQETLKIVVNNNSSYKLQEELKSLGQILTSNTQKEDLNSKYNEKVAQYMTLQSQFRTATTQEELKQIQVKMAGIEAQLKALDREAETDTIILWLKK